MVTIMTMTPTMPATQMLPASWRLADGYLTETRSDGALRLWGLWDGGSFGCWDAAGSPVVPEWEPLGHLGRWQEPAGPRDDAWYASRAALAAYWSAVPTPVRLMVSKAPGGQWQALKDRWRATQSARSQGDILLASPGISQSLGQGSSTALAGAGSSSGAPLTAAG